MRIKEFAQKYCQSMLQDLKHQQDILGDDDLSYDEIIQDIDGNPVKIVYAGTTEIPIEDILCMERVDFTKAYPGPVALEVYDRYIDSIIILEGEEALMRIRNLIRIQQEQIEMFANMPEEFQ